MVMKPMPKGTKDIKALADQLYTGMVGRENEAVEKIRKVIEFATADDCGCRVSINERRGLNVSLGRHGPGSRCVFRGRGRRP